VAQFRHQTQWQKETQTEFIARKPIKLLKKKKDKRNEFGDEEGILTKTNKKKTMRLKRITLGGPSKFQRMGENLKNVIP
jgi:hypothetical protein